MRKILLAFIIFVILLSGCVSEYSPSGDFSDYELVIDGDLVTERPNVSFFKDLGFTQVERQGCDDCHMDTITLEGKGLIIEGRRMNIENHKHDTNIYFSSYTVKIKDQKHKTVKMSGGIELGKTTEADLISIIEQEGSYNEGLDANGLKTITYWTETTPLTFTFEDDILKSIDIMAIEEVFEYRDLIEPFELPEVFTLTTVKELDMLRKSGADFVFVASFEDCPWCKRFMPYLHKVALEYGRNIAYLDTRANPEWESNLDIDDYDLFVEMFGEHLEIDENGIPHLYVPDAYFIRNGKVVARFDGTIEGADNPKVPLTEKQEEWLINELRNCFEKL